MNADEIAGYLALVIAGAWLAIPAAAVLTIDAVSRLRARRARQNTIGQSREVHIDLPPKPLPEFVMPTCGHAGCIAAAVVLRDRLAAAIAAGIAQDTEREWAAMNGDAS